MSGMGGVERTDGVERGRCSARRAHSEISVCVVRDEFRESRVRIYLLWLCVCVCRNTGWHVYTQLHTCERDIGRKKDRGSSLRLAREPLARRGESPAFPRARDFIRNSYLF